MIPLIIGIALALAALAFVVAPLVRRPVVGAGSVAPTSAHADRTDGSPSGDTRSPSPEAPDTVVDTDWSSDLDTEAERLVREARATVVSCGTCGQRPESDAVFCSNCGKPVGVCSKCRFPVAVVGSSYCASCGAALSA